MNLEIFDNEIFVKKSNFEEFHSSLFLPFFLLVVCRDFREEEDVKRSRFSLPDKLV